MSSRDTGTNGTNNVSDYDGRGPTKVHTRTLLSNALGIYIFLTIGLMGRIWVMSKIEEFSVIINPFIWGAAYACGMFVSGGYSGAAFHPGVALGYAWKSRGDNSFLKALSYIACDMVAAGLAATTVMFLTFYEAQLHFGKDFQKDGNARELYVHEFNSDSNWVEVYADVILASFFYAFILAGITDYRNHNIDRCWRPFYAAIDVTVVGLAFGYTHGSSFNPYIDFVPRIVCSCARFSHCWTPWYHVVVNLILGTLFAALGVLVYEMLLLDKIKDRDHLVPHFGGRKQVKKVRLRGDRNGPSGGHQNPFLVAQDRENFNYLLKAEEE